jgi:hypothetical protein
MIYISKGEIVIAPKVKSEDINRFDANKKSLINNKNIKLSLEK